MTKKRTVLKSASGYVPVISGAMAGLRRSSIGNLSGRARLTGTEFLGAVTLGIDALLAELDLGEVLSDSVPLATTVSEGIERLRHWSQGRARHATHANQPCHGKRKLLDLS